MHKKFNYKIIGLFLVLSLFLSISSSASAHNRDVYNSLLKVKFLEHLNETDIRSIENISVLRSGNIEEKIIIQEQKIENLFVLLEGQASIHVNGKHVITLDAQQTFGEAHLTKRIEASGDVILTRESTILEINIDKLINLMEEDNELGYKILKEFVKILSERLSNMNP